MKLVIGGAFQGKLDFAKKMTGKETGWPMGQQFRKEGAVGMFRRI